ncbi:MAG: enolase C-terminal domain-like protein, partial [Acidimicrobiales bacterium]
TAIAIACLLASPRARAQAWPAQPIKIVVPYGPGGATDTAGRLLAEKMTSLDAIEAAVALGACEVVCLKPARVGGWIAARAVHDRCAELGVPVWVGGMLETGVGRAANLAVAALPSIALPPDMDPRGRYDPDLAEPSRPVDGAIPLPLGAGTGAIPSLEGRDGVQVLAGWRR